MWFNGVIIKYSALPACSPTLKCYRKTFIQKSRVNNFHFVLSILSIKYTVVSKIYLINKGTCQNKTFPSQCSTHFQIQLV